MHKQEIETRFRNTKRSKTFNNIIKRFDLDTKSVFDIGCTYGEFLIHFGKGSIGLTIVDEEVEYGKQNGLDIRYGDIESDILRAVHNETFDVIFANNLFEHLFFPHLFLHSIKKFLKPGGTLILGVPCLPKALFLLRFNKFRGSLSTSHINFFTRDTLKKTVEGGGWNVSTIRGFRFYNKILDKLLDPIYPHFYVIATSTPRFTCEMCGYAKRENQWLL